MAAVWRLGLVLVVVLGLGLGLVLRLLGLSKLRLMLGLQLGLYGRRTCAHLHRAKSSLPCRAGIAC